MEGMAACSDLDNTSMGMFNCSILETYSNCTEQLGDVCSNGGLCESEPDLFKGVTIVLVFAISLIGNLCTILILSQFKTHKIPDVLVIGLALTDLLATIIPIAAAMYSYFSGFDFVPGCVVCNISGTVAQFTRYSSSLIVTLVSLERYFAVCRPFIYRQHATPKRFVIILILCWLVALVLATIPLMGFNTDILSFDGVCLFDLTSNYAIAIVLYAAVQYVIVFVCFVLVATELCKVYRRRKKLKVQGEYNDNSMARHRSRTQSVTTFTKPNLTSRISDLGKSIKAAAPLITEKLQLGVEAQFARMLFAVVALFYISWTVIVAVIVVSEIRRGFTGLENVLFWGLRLTVVSTAVNPFLYGILARQYRLAYYYVLQLWFSKCFCYCVSPPLKDVFAAARNFGGDVQRRGSRLTQRSGGSSAGGHRHVNKTSNVLLTNANHLALGGLNISLPPRLSQIHEEMAMEPNESSVAAEFTTHVPTAGELSSTVTIPCQARDHNDSSTVELEMRGAASMQDLVDAGMVELGNTRHPQSGVENPLAMITKVVGGEEVTVSPSLEYEGAHTEFRASPQFSNPVYELSNGHTSPRTRAQIEADIANRQNMLAASSTDDITLISKKKKVSKTLSGDAPYCYSNPNMAAESPPMRNRGLKISLKEISRGKRSYQPLQNNAAGSPLKREITATDIDTGRTVLVSSQDNLDYPPPALVEVRDVSKASSCSPAHQAPPGIGTIQAHTHSRSFDLADMDSGSKVKHRNAVNSELSEKQGVHVLRGVFENSSPSRQQTTPTSRHNGNSHHQPRAHSHNGPGRRNSTENSDSGRESMVLDSDPVQAV